VDEPLLLLHGLGMSARVWAPLVPHLESRHQVVTLTMVGHRGGARASRRPVAVGDLVDDVERALDAAGLHQPHVAGNSLGGWVAIELARRGRARSVCALSPAGSWRARTRDQTLGVGKLRRAARAARIGRALPLTVALRSRSVRRVVFRDVAEHGDRLSSAQAVDTIDDLLGCEILEDVLRTTEELAPLDPLPCPITLAWSGADAILPLAVNGVLAYKRLPGARLLVLPGVGHVPMIDDPEQVLTVILETTALAENSPTAAPPFG
jgi:pimeloyl-ACP methyl ester carboxylesterase